MRRALRPPAGLAMLSLVAVISAGCSNAPADTGSSNSTAATHESSVGGRWIWSRRGNPVAEVARLLEVSDQSIYSWRRQDLIDCGELPGLSSPERECA
jgi:hypothetical protein